MREYRRGLRLDPANVNLLNSMGVACVQLNRARAARSFFQQALEVDAKNFMALFNLGFVFLEAGEQGMARELWERALAVDAEHTDLLQHLGVLCCRQGEYARAKELLGRCENLIRRDSLRGGERLVLARWMGRAREALGETAGAIASYQQAVSGNPRDAGSLGRLGRLYAVARQGDDIALALCRQAVELDGGKADHWYRLGWVQESVGDHKGASRSLSECLRLAPRHVEAALLLGRVCVQAGQRGKARRVYGKVLHFFPDQEQARAALADLRS
jgi:tetratricopeptide (TPR) repeat protein